MVAVLLILTTSILMTQDAKARSAERQESNMRVAWTVLGQYGRREAHVEGGFEDDCLR